MIKTEALYKIYQMGDAEVRALDGVSLTIAEGEMVAIMGPSGSGKSTFMNTLGCLDQPTSGSYQLDGEETAQLSEKEKARLRNQKIGFVFQSFNLLPNLTALQNVELPLVYAGVPASKRQKIAMEAIERLGLGHRVHHKPKELSGGQQQRVAIARALVNRPKLLLADEPTGNLDSKSSREIMAVFQELHQNGITIVLVTHEEDIAAYTERIVRFTDGKVVDDRRIKQKVINEEVLV
ncbi:MAG TPA: ABC transporter ATP-binding protein [Bacillota bacterium]|jgi:putative ABC transport system ATP-binding protein|nr:ABC transporter ATP-binding protein [Bacillota bacterium]HOL09666.1 ABC transporter ATP-binding protein [Bacillota bacterium]HPO97518.1 ABC transporter ATP-binding protein [Bacillota bacterium]